MFQAAIDPPGEWGLWSIEEEESALRASVPLFPDEHRQLDRIRGEARRREFLAARLLLHRMSGRSQRAELIKDTDGKPHLADSPFFVSISHTVGYAAAIAHPRRCGIDVQRIVGRIRRLAPKFVNQREHSNIGPADELTDLHLIWSAKEAIYKAYGRRQLDFRRDMYVALGEAPTAELRVGDTTHRFNLFTKVYHGFVLVSAVEALDRSVFGSL